MGKSNKMSPGLDIITVNWNSKGHLGNCLRSISSSITEGFRLNRVIVVDNASIDGSLNGIEDISVPLEIIRNPDNLGFAAACNVGARESEAEYLLFLNPDAVLYPDSLRKSISFMENPENAGIGICGVQMLEENGEVARSCLRFPTMWSFVKHSMGLSKFFPHLFPSFFMWEWDHKAGRKVDHVIGAFFLVRRAVFELLNGMSEVFFLYYEDLDFCLRAKVAGWNSYYLADVQIRHVGGGVTSQISGKKLYYLYQNQILYCYKNMRFFPATVVAVATLFVEPLARLMSGALSLSGRTVIETASATAMTWRDFPDLCSKIRNLLRAKSETRPL